MEMLDFAIQMEQEGLQFLTQAAKNVRNNAAQTLLQSLARDEIRHELILKNLKQGELGFIHGEVLSGVKNIFEQLTDSGATLFSEDDNLSDILRKGISLERKSIGLYHKLFNDTDDPERKKVWETLRTEEQKHEKLLRLTLEYVDRPEVVLENAEFLFHGHEEAP